ncbi:hypothetical protein Tco_1005903 [Tanacetum coccineum]|uniref:Uncharacterized protein n=1 Tax=Tanacetum coccineum TaxID=301880 RepID=A0ABQ5FHE4_9ASTR
MPLNGAHTGTNPTRWLAMKSRHALKGLKNEKEIMDPGDACTTSSQLLKVRTTSEVVLQNSRDYTHFLLTVPHSALVDIERRHSAQPTDHKIKVQLLKRFNTTAGNPVQKILLKLNPI